MSNTIFTAEQNRVFTLKNKYVVGLASWLNGLQLTGRLSRHRTRFVKDLSIVIRSFNDLYMKFLEANCPKDSKGEFKTREEGGAKIYDVERSKVLLFQGENESLMSNDFSVAITPENNAQMLALKELVLGTDYPFGPGAKDTEQERVAKVRQAEDYEEWCNAFEKI